jgi:N-acetylmuramoyl-L-alanine amidase
LSNFKIAIDVGHTPQASGATSARGTQEFAFNLALAKQIVQSLNRGGFKNVLELTVTGTGRRQLIDRVALANTAKVNLLLSIHHDDVQSSYYKTWSFDSVTHFYSDNFSGYSLFVSHENRFWESSWSFASLLGRELISRGMHFTFHHAEHIPGENRELLDDRRGIYRYDRLFVLRNTLAPAVLLEAGVIVNRDEELILKSPQRQSAVGEAVLLAAKQFCIGTPAGH